MAGKSEIGRYALAAAAVSELAKVTDKHCLDHTRACLEAMGLERLPFEVIHVAGTNGKGSVCAALEAILRTGGVRCGLFTSPHLISVRERFVIDGARITREAFADAYFAVERAIDPLIRKGLPHPSYFETLFLMAAYAFARAGVEVAVMEAGLGGLRDATNVIEEPLAAVITSIGLEHTQYLGRTVREIAAQKTGIIKRGRPVIFDGGSREASEIIRKTAAACKSPAYAIRREGGSTGSERPSGSTGSEAESVDEVRILGVGREGVRFALGERPYFLPIPAPYEADNAALAVRTVCLLRETRPSLFGSITDTVIRQGLASVIWHGRMEFVRPDICLDGAHNPAGIRAFIEAVRAIDPREVHLLIGVMADKDFGDMVRELTGDLTLKRVTVTEPPDGRAMRSDDLTELFRKAAGEGSGTEILAEPDLKKALEGALAGRGRGTLFVIGSLYLIGEVRRLLEEHP